MRVFDNPNHRGYGPVRRTWVILAGLDLLTPALDREYDACYGAQWDECMADAIVAGKTTEGQVARLIVYRMLVLRRETL